MKMILETDRLPSVVQDFLRNADALRKLIEKATLEVVEDIKAMLYDHDSKSFRLCERDHLFTGVQSTDGLVATR